MDYEGLRFTRYFSTLFSAIFYLFSFFSYGAITVSPLSSVLDLGESKSKTLMVFNADPQRTIAIKVVVFKWGLGEDGSEKRYFTDSIEVFPSQFVLKPKAKRSIRIRPISSQPPNIEESYRVIVRELPIDFDNNNTESKGVRLLTSYATAFYISPIEAFSNLIANHLSFDKNKVYFTLKNVGNAHTHLRDLKIMVEQKSTVTTITDTEELGGLLGENILSQSERKFELSLPLEFSAKLNVQIPIKVVLNYSCEFCANSNVELIFTSDQF